MRFFPRRSIAASARRAHNIRLKLHDINGLFNSMDPSPFIERGLDHDAEEFIVSSAHELPADAPLKLRIDLEDWPAEDPGELIRQAIHHHFAHRTHLADMEFRRLMRQGRTSLLIGLAFLSSCLVVTQTVLSGEAGTWATVVRESLTIAGWVAMWRPMQIYLYDWWPLRRTSRVYAKLSRMSVEVAKPRS